MDILPSCVQCGNAFTPRNRTQKYCIPCVHEPCIDCGSKKHRSARGPRCRKCTDLNNIGKANLKNRREEKSIEQVIVEVEAFGLLPEKQYAFGYVIGVVFGDGCVSRVAISQSHIRSDGTRTPGRGSAYLIRLSVTSQAFAECFASQWKVLTSRPIKVWTSTRTDFSKSTLKGRSEQYNVQLFNVNPCHVLLGRYFSHLKYESDPSVLLRFPLEVMRGVVHGMIDSEGYLNPKRPEHIDIANKDITLLDTLVLMLNCLEFGGKVYTNPSQSVSHLVTSMPYTKYGL